MRAAPGLAAWAPPCPAMLDRYRIKSTFFTTGHSVLAYPEPSRAIKAGVMRSAITGGPRESAHAHAQTRAGHDGEGSQSSRPGARRAAGGLSFACLGQQRCDRPTVTRIWLRVRKQPDRRKLPALLVRRRRRMGDHRGVPL